MAQNTDKPNVLLMSADEGGGALVKTWLMRGGCCVQLAESIHGIIHAGTWIDVIVIACAQPAPIFLTECRVLKQSLGSLAPTVIMLCDTADKQLVESLYGAGVDLLMPLPVCEERLVKPILLLVGQVRAKQHLHQQNVLAKCAAFDSSNTSAQLHQTTKVLSELIVNDSFEALSASLFGLLRDWGVASSIVVHGEVQHHYFSDDGTIHPLEQELAVMCWESIRSQNAPRRCVRTGSGRAIVCFSLISIIIRRGAPERISKIIEALQAMGESLDRAVQSVWRTRDAQDNQAQTIDFGEAGRFGIAEGSVADSLSTLIADMAQKHAAIPEEQEHQSEPTKAGRSQ